VKGENLMRSLKTLLCCGAVAAMFVAHGTDAQEWTKTTYFTFSSAVQLPGVTLQAGEYMFKLADPETGRRAIGVWDKQGSKFYGMMQTRIDERAFDPSDLKDSVIMFRESPAGEPQAVRTYVYAGERRGHEFIYPRAQASKIAKANQATVLATEAGDLGQVDHTGTYAVTVPAALVVSMTTPKVETPEPPQVVSLTTPKVETPEPPQVVSLTTPKVETPEPPQVVSLTEPDPPPVASATTIDPAPVVSLTIPSATTIDPPKIETATTIDPEPATATATATTAAATTIDPPLVVSLTTASTTAPVVVVEPVTSTPAKAIVVEEAAVIPAPEPAPAYEPPQPVATAGELPKTSSTLPAFQLMGGLSLLSGLLVRRFRMRKAHV
jgi:hypothetical protein